MAPVFNTTIASMFPFVPSELKKFIVNLKVLTLGNFSETLCFTQSK